MFLRCHLLLWASHYFLLFIIVSVVEEFSRVYSPTPLVLSFFEDNSSVSGSI